jgi:hypothetical protein
MTRTDSLDGRIGLRTNTDDGADGNGQRDHPLSCNWRTVTPDAFDFLGLPPLRSKLATSARQHILTEAFVVGRAHPDTWISYSRAKTFYTSRAGHRYWPTTYSYRSIVPTVDQLTEEGLLDHERMPVTAAGSPGSRHRQNFSGGRTRCRSPSCMIRAS